MGGNVETLPWLRGGACQMGVESPCQKTACHLVRLTGKNQPAETLRCVVELIEFKIIVIIRALLSHSDGQ